MPCPNCNSKNFAPFSHEGVEFDFCPDCLGVWCDHGELAQYVETINDSHSYEDGKLIEMKCPKCGTHTLHEMPYLSEKKLLIDKCTTCQGIWLDAKELAQIQKLAASIDTDGKLERTLKHMQDQGFKVF